MHNIFVTLSDEGYDQNMDRIVSHGNYIYTYIYIYNSIKSWQTKPALPFSCIHHSNRTNCMRWKIRTVLIMNTFGQWSSHLNVVKNMGFILGYPQQKYIELKFLTTLRCDDHWPNVFIINTVLIFHRMQFVLLLWCMQENGRAGFVCHDFMLLSNHFSLGWLYVFISFPSPRPPPRPPSQWLLPLKVKTGAWIQKICFSAW